MTGMADAGGWQRAIGRATAEHEDRHPRSRDVSRQMSAWLPGADTRSRPSRKRPFERPWSGASSSARRCAIRAPWPSTSSGRLPAVMTQETVDRAVSAVDDALAEAERLRA